MGDGGGEVVVSAWHEYVGDTRGSGIVDLIGMRGVSEMCMCFARGSVGAE